MVTKEFFIQNRREFEELMPAGSVCFLFAGETKLQSLEEEYRFFADVNFYYLTGITDAGITLVIDKTGDSVEETLFAPEKDALIERWHGRRKTFDELKAISGIESVEPDEKFDEYMLELAGKGCPSGFDLTSVMEGPSKFSKNFRGEIFDISKILTPMRKIKKPEEIACIKEACRITEEALAEFKKVIAPGKSEYELFTRLEYEIARRSDLTFAFSTITAVGDNAFYLHHSVPDKDNFVVSGGQIQIDCGARFAGYCADISRAYLIGDGGADDKRYLVHGLVKTLRDRALEFIKPGITFDDLNKEMHDICGAQLASWGLIPKDFTTEDVRKYYWHNTSHYLGLDVHDVGDRKLPLEAGCALAVEPGVYIPEWHAGFRIEDDLLVTADGCEKLSSWSDSLDSCKV